MTTQTATATKTAEKTRYNISGVLENVVNRTDKHGKPYVTFRLKREGKRAVSGVAFADRATTLTSNYAEGDHVNLYGVFEPREFTGTDGAQVTYNRFTVLSVKVPQPANDAQPSDEAGDTAAAA